MRNLRFLVFVLAIVGVCSVAGAQGFMEDFESYAAGSAMHGQGGWKGWDNVAGAGAPASSAYAYSGSISVEIIGSADLVHEFDIRGGRWELSAMQYLPSGTTGITYFILLNTYNDGANAAKDWSVQVAFNLASGQVDFQDGAGTVMATATFLYDEWVELKFIINLDNNTVDGYYNGEFVVSHPWDNNVNGTLQCIDLYGNSASSVYYDDVKVEQFFLYQAYEPDPADGTIGAVTPLLKWTAGDTAAFHDVYFGTNPAPGPDEFIGRQPGIQNLYYHVAGLIPGTTYYWRIDEVEADGTTIHTGDVWSFTAAPLSAYNPDPADGAKWVDTEADLSWGSGATAIFHDVYFGTNQTDVADGTGDTFKGKQPLENYDPGTLALETTYYWRVDEYDQGDTKYPGEVWSFTTMPIISITDPNLLGRWTLDEGEGTTAIDWSGHGNHGVLRNEPQWLLDGYYGGALAFDGQNDYVSVPLDVSETEYAAALWFKTTNADCGLMAVVDTDMGPSHDRHIYLTGGNIRIRLWDTEEIWTTGLDLADGLWHHVAYTYGAAIGGQRVYVDGVLRASGTKDASDFDWQLRVNIGFSHDAVNDFFEGVLDDVRIYDKTLTQAEIQQVMRGDPLLAWNPKPANASIPDIEHAKPLSWSPGDNAAQHDVYFGTDRDAVEDADTTTTGIYRGRQDPNTYMPEGLEWGGGPYYWRIDEFNTDATISTGRVWSFTVANYLIPDDFEAYDDYCNRIFYAWTDGWGHSADPDCAVPASTGNGTGSTVGNLAAPFAEQTIVHGGIQSMPFEYNNTGTGGKARYSEASLEFASPRDWTKGDVKALTLWFYGDPANEAEQFYVAVEDNAGHVKVVNHPEPPRIQIGRWQEWNIELDEFSGASVNLAAVKKMYIGLGNRSNPQAGGSGKLYIDDIRVYPARCVPSMGQPAADLSGNCVVDYADVELLTNLWLDSGFVITPANPGTANLAAHWKFDGDAQDSSGNAHHGFVGGTTEWVAGVSGNALRFDGLSTYVDVSDTIVEGSFTLALWLKYDTLRQGGYNAVMHTDGWTTGSVHVHMRSGTRLFNFDVNGGLGATTNIALDAGEWYHVVGSVDTSEPVAKVYVDGVLDGTNTSGGAATPSIGLLNIGAWNDNDRFFDGVMDDFRIYDRALSAAEIAWLAGYTSPLSIPADLYQDDVIDFKDLAVLGDSWLEEILWP